MNRPQQISTILLLSLLLILIFTGSGLAAEFSSDSIIEADEVINDDIFIATENVLIEGTINGNAFLNANNVTITGVINGDLFIFAANTEVVGKVNGNLVIGGRTSQIAADITGSLFFFNAGLTLQGPAHVGRNLYGLGYGLIGQPGSMVEQDVFFAGSQVELNNKIGRDVKADVSAAHIRGSIGRDLVLNVSAPEQSPARWQLEGAPEAIMSGLHISQEAQIGGTLTYTSTINQNAQILAKPAGGVIFHLDENESTAQSKTLRQKMRENAMGGLRQVIILFILGAVALVMFKDLFYKASASVSSPLPAAMRGLLAFLIGHAGFLVVLILLIIISLLFASITLVGITFFVIFLGISGLIFIFSLFSLVLWFGSRLVVAQWIGQWLFQRFWPASQAPALLPLIAGILLVVLLGLIPLVGILFTTVFILVGTGAWIMRIYDLWKNRRPNQAQSADSAGG